MGRTFSDRNPFLDVIWRALQAFNCAPVQVWSVTNTTHTYRLHWQQQREQRSTNFGETLAHVVERMATKEDVRSIVAEELAPGSSPNRGSAPGDDLGGAV